MTNRGSRDVSSVILTNGSEPSSSPRGVLRVGLLQVAAVLFWLWPIGLGGRMPVGGDVTQFSIGLMAFLGRSLREWRLPLWNDLWGYGFPGVGESQMGVFYPPHWLLYGLLPVEWGYTASLVLHTLWGSLGASWTARRFGVSPVGSALSGFAFATSGFFYVHLSHQWGATTGCWMPWAWGMAWRVLTSDRPGRSAVWLSVILTLQMLPGHYQLAFVTQVGVVVLAAVGLLGRSRRPWRSLLAILAVGYAFLLGAVQLWPTLRLARLAETRRDFEYLSGFAASPMHLVTFLAPGLFERSPLWRPIVWDPFHTSPEEYLGYVGLAPLFLAALAVTRRWRSPEVLALLVAGLVSLLLALGPYAPGFRSWSTWPGFSFFRAPSRWMIGLSLSLSLLAGIGFDGLTAWPRVGRALLRFVVAASLIVLGALAVCEVGLRAGEFSDRTLAKGYARALDALPWGEAGVYEKILIDARRPNPDHRVSEARARQGVDLKTAPAPVFLSERGRIYRQELSPTLVLLLAMAAMAWLGRHPKTLQAGLIALAFVDLIELSRERRVDLGPIAPLAGQSPVLRRLSDEPRGIRSIDTLRNLPMVVGASPVSAYRTLDLPTLDTLNLLASRRPARPEEIPALNFARRLTGASLRVFESSELAELDRVGLRESGGTRPGPLIEDPVLACWRLGIDWVRGTGRPSWLFRVDEVEGGGTLAWRLPLTPSRSSAILEPWSGHPGVVLEAMEGAEPLTVDSTDPEHLSVTLLGQGPTLLVLSRLADPQWRGEWSGPTGTIPATILRAFGRPGQGAWQAVEVPGQGNWTLRLTYVGEDVWIGLGVSGIAAGGLLALALAARFCFRSGRVVKERT